MNAQIANSGERWHELIRAIGRLLGALANRLGRGGGLDHHGRAAAETACALCQRALWTPDAVLTPDLCMQVSTVLAQLLLELPVDDVQGPIEELLTVSLRSLSDQAGSQAAQFCTPVHVLLACAYKSRRAGNRKENMLAALRHFNRALECSEYLPTSLLASVHHHLGALYTSHLSELGTNASASAIQHCRSALHLIDKQDDPFRWAVLQSDLGLAYCSGTATDTEAALEHLGQALSVLTPDEHPRYWAQAHHRLGLAFMHRTRGDVGENREKAESHFKRALEVSGTHEWLRERAATLLSLGRLYYRVQGVLPESMSLAIECCEQALRAATKTNDSALCASIHYALGRAYLRRQGPDKTGDLRRAVTSFRSALGELDAVRRPTAIAIATRELAKAEELLRTQSY